MNFLNCLDLTYADSLSRYYYTVYLYMHPFGDHSAFPAFESSRFKVLGLNHIFANTLTSSLIKVSEFVSLIIFCCLFVSEIFFTPNKTLLDLLDLTYNLISGEANFNTKVTMLNLRPDKL